MMTSTCKGCGASIVWIVTEAGKNMPLDAKTTTMWLVDAEGAQQGSPRAKPVQVRAPHWSTCPNADDFRRPR